MSTPYVYIVKNLTTGYKYVGSRYSKNCTPFDLWKTYFTSSLNIKKLIELYGKEDFQYRILKTFNTSYETLKYERELIDLSFLKENYINFHNNFIGNMNERRFIENQKRQKISASIVGLQCVENKTGLFSLTEDERLNVCRIEGLQAGIVNKERGTGIFSKDVQKRQHDTLREKQVSAFYDPILRLELSSIGGQNGMFSKAYAERNGISEEDMKKLQSERGKKGGVKHKGSRTYTDGINEFKYSATRQLEESFDMFLENNPNYKAGRVPKLKTETLQK